MAAVDLDELEARCGRDWCRVPCSKDELRALITELRTLRASAAEGQREWIATSERMPARFEKVIFRQEAWPAGEVCLGEFDYDVKRWQSEDELHCGDPRYSYAPDEIAHWSRLPSPPEKGSI